MFTGATPMQADDSQQPQTTATVRQQGAQSMQEPDLNPREGVGRCYYTQMPKLVKVTPVSANCL